IRFQDISVEAEVEQEFFIEQPIKITSVGEYHQFGDFLTGISTLPRIITMHDFEIKNQKPSLDVMPELQLVLNTKTYRSKEIKQEDVTQAQGANADKAGNQKQGGSK
ncbi:MAG: type 4a pilus biogenesis protein PilO, partial [Moraxella sp.]|nr:type 4a pilus biogenesis protein PilO [Moraxella sp.]